MDDGNTQCLRRVFFGGGRKSQPLSSHCEAAVNVKVSRMVYANTTRDQYRFVNAEVEVEHETRDNAEWVSATQLAYISLTCHVIGHRLELFFFTPDPNPTVFFVRSRSAQCEARRRRQLHRLAAR